jgi:hypothetical protein
MRVNSDHGNQNKINNTRQSVYDGQDRLGDVQERDGEFVARDRQGNIIGIFHSLSAAATGCWKVAHGRGVP